MVQYLKHCYKYTQYSNGKVHFYTVTCTIKRKFELIIAFRLEIKAFKSKGILYSLLASKQLNPHKRVKDGIFKRPRSLR